MQKHLTRIFALVLVLPLLLCLLVACGAGDNGTGSGKILIKIGSDFPTSGDDQSAGLPAQNGAQAAVAEAATSNFLGNGYELQLDAHDDVGANGAHDGTVALTNVNQMIGDAQVSAIVGPLNSSIAVAIMNAANKAPIGIISPSNSNDCLTQDTPDYACGGSKSQLSKLRPTGKVTYFRLATLDQYQGHALASFANEKGYHKAYIIDDTETYGKGLADSFEYFWKNTYKGEVLNHTGIVKQDNYDSLLKTIAAAKPDFIFFGGNDSTGGDSIRVRMPQIKGLENTPLFLGDGAKTITLAKDSIAAGGGPVYASVPGLDPSVVGTKAADFQTSFTKTYGTAGAYSGGTYDCTWIVLKAIKKVLDGGSKPPADAADRDGANTFRQKVIDAIASTSYDGVTGHHNFDKNGDTSNRNISIYTLGAVDVADGWKYLKGVDPTKPGV